MLHFSISRAGSFDVLYRDNLLLQDCFPAANGRPLRVLQTEKRENTVLLTTEWGNLRLEFYSYGENLLCISPFLEDYGSPLHDFSLFSGAVLPGFSGWFQQAEGLGGSCGYKKNCGETPADSYGLISLRSGLGYLTLYVPNQRKYPSRFRLCSAEGGVLLGGEYRTENCNKQREALPQLYLYFSQTLEEGLNYAAKAIGDFMGARRCQPPAYHWCSWYYSYQNFNRKQLGDYLEGFQKAELHPRYVQIDAGNSTDIGDWFCPNENWPTGFEEAFSSIRDAGYGAGIWIGPFMVGNRSKLFTEHPDWVLYDLEGKPLVCLVTDNEPKLWNYPDEEYYSLDCSHPDAMEYLRQVFLSMKNWGATLFKTDFMYWGYQDSTKVRRHSPGKTSVEYFRDVLQMIREEIGEESYWLGCIAPFFPFIGYADGMRVGGDVGSCWNGIFNPQDMISTIVGNNHTNHLFYQNDPDAVLLRDIHIRLTDREVLSLSRLAAMSGGCFYTSDPLHLIREDRRRLFTYFRPDCRRKPSLPFQDDPEKSCVVSVQKNKAGTKALVLTFNKEDDFRFEEYPLTTLGFPGTLYAYDLETGIRSEAPVSSLLTRTEAHGSRLFLVSENPEENLQTATLWELLGDALEIS